MTFTDLKYIFISAIFYCIFYRNGDNWSVFQDLLSIFSTTSNSMTPHQKFYDTSTINFVCHQHMISITIFLISYKFFVVSCYLILTLFFSGECYKIACKYSTVSGMLNWNDTFREVLNYCNIFLQLIGIFTALCVSKKTSCYFGYKFLFKTVFIFRSFYIF